MTEPFQIVKICFKRISHFLQPLTGIYDAFYKGDYCNSVANMVPQFGIIVGHLPLEGNAVYSTKSHQVTVVGSLTINNALYWNGQWECYTGYLKSPSISTT